jgi:hypothetical protein
VACRHRMRGRTETARMRAFCCTLVTLPAHSARDRAHSRSVR